MAGPISGRRDCVIIPRPNRTVVVFQSRKSAVMTWGLIEQADVGTQYDLRVGRRELIIPDHDCQVPGSVSRHHPLPAAMTIDEDLIGDGADPEVAA